MSKALHAMVQQRQTGFSLAELLVTVAIVAIATSIGLPLMKSFIDDAGVSGTADQVLAGLNYTRSEAIKRNARVTMCRSSTGIACATAAAADGDWRVGWIVFVDGDDAGQVDDDDEILRVQGALSGTGQLLGTADVSDYVSYMSSGQPRLADNTAPEGEFAVCADSAESKRRKIALRPGTGWVGVEIVAASATCTS